MHAFPCAVKRCKERLDILFVEGLAFPRSRRELIGEFHGKRAHHSWRVNQVIHLVLYNYVGFMRKYEI